MRATIQGLIGKVSQRAWRRARDLGVVSPELVRRAREVFRPARTREPEAKPLRSSDIYERLYEAQGASLPATSSIGDGDFDLIGRIELGILVQEGLEPPNTLLDLGCGTRRLAVHAIPFLQGGDTWVWTSLSRCWTARDSSWKEP